MDNIVSIVGEEKCGSTSLYHLLNQHPDITMANTTRPRFFEYEYPKGKEFYESKYFNNAKSIYYGESRVNGMLAPFIIDRMLETYASVKTIAILRCPAKRFISAWSHMKNMRPGKETRTLRTAIIESFFNYNDNEAINEYELCKSNDVMGGTYRDFYAERGFYSKNIEKILNETNLYVATLEQLQNEQEDLINSIFSFLGLKKININTEHRNEGKGDKSSFYPEEFTFLKAMYREDIEKLSEDIGIDYLKLWGY